MCISNLNPTCTKTINKTSDTRDIDLKGRKEMKYTFEFSTNYVKEQKKNEIQYWYWQINQYMVIGLLSRYHMGIFLMILPFPH